MRKNIGRKLFCLVFVMVAFSLIVFSGCGGGSGGSSDCDDPALDTTGTWCVSITGSTGTCGPSDTTPYNAEYTQNGNKVSATANGGTYSGTICGDEATLTGSNFGFDTTTKVTFSDDSHASGTTKYSNDSCSGTDTSEAVKGSCP